MDARSLFQEEFRRIPAYQISSNNRRIVKESIENAAIGHFGPVAEQFASGAKDIYAVFEKLFPKRWESLAAGAIPLSEGEVAEKLRGLKGPCWQNNQKRLVETFEMAKGGHLGETARLIVELGYIENPRDLLVSLFPERQQGILFGTIQLTDAEISERLKLVDSYREDYDPSVDPFAMDLEKLATSDFSFSSSSSDPFDYSSTESISSSDASSSSRASSSGPSQGLGEPSGGDPILEGAIESLSYSDGKGKSKAEVQ